MRCTWPSCTRVLALLTTGVAPPAQHYSTVLFPSLPAKTSAPPASRPSGPAPLRPRWNAIHTKFIYLLFITTKPMEWITDAFPLHILLFFFLFSASFSFYACYVPWPRLVLFKTNGGRWNADVKTLGLSGFSKWENTLSLGTPKIQKKKWLGKGRRENATLLVQWQNLMMHW